MKQKSSNRGDRTRFPLPIPIDDGSRLCIKVYVPNIPGHRQAFQGAIYNLTKYYSWQNVPERTGDLAAAVWSEIYDEMMETFYEDCPMTVPLFRFTEDCNLQVSVDGIDYETVPGWAEFGASCFTGAPGAPGTPGTDGVDGVDGENGLNGAPGAPGAPGADGVDGVDGDCADCGDSSAPVEVDTDEWEQQACAMAKGLAEYMVEKSVSAITIIKAAFIAGKEIADQATDLLDAIPVFGAIINNIIDVSVAMAVEGDYDDIIGHISDPDFEIQVACELYCYWKNLSLAEFTPENVRLGLTEVVSWATALPPGLPLITFYGQAFALLVGSMHMNEAHRRAAVHADERSDDCELLCVECPDDPEDNCYEKFSLVWGAYDGEFDGWQRYTSTVADGRSKFQIQTGTPTDCCFLLEVREVTSLNPQRFHIVCPNANVIENLVLNWPVNTCVNVLSAQLGAGNTAPFTIEFKLIECE